MTFHFEWLAAVHHRVCWGGGSKTQQAVSGADKHHVGSQLESQVLPSAIWITMETAKYTTSALISSDSTYCSPCVMATWAFCLPVLQIHLLHRHKYGVSLIYHQHSCSIGDGSHSLMIWRDKLDNAWVAGDDIPLPVSTLVCKMTKIRDAVPAVIRPGDEHTAEFDLTGLTPVGLICCISRIFLIHPINIIAAIPHRRPATRRSSESM